MKLLTIPLVINHLIFDGVVSSWKEILEGGTRGSTINHFIYKDFQLLNNSVWLFHFKDNFIPFL